MIKIYVMESCHDCVEVKQAGDLKEFLVIRDTDMAFEKVRSVVI